MLENQRPSSPRAFGKSSKLKALGLQMFFGRLFRLLGWEVVRLCRGSLRIETQYEGRYLSVLLLFGIMGKQPCWAQVLLIVELTEYLRSALHYGSSQDALGDAFRLQIASGVSPLAVEA